MKQIPCTTVTHNKTHKLAHKIGHVIYHIYIHTPWNKKKCLNLGIAKIRGNPPPHEIWAPEEHFSV